MNPVLCITRSLLPIGNGLGIVPFDGTFKPDSIHFIHRSIVDDSLSINKDIGHHLPQVLPYIAVKCGTEYLTYSRKGTEARLHGKLSMGFGGHVELSDLTKLETIKDLVDTAKRELKEELGIDVEVTLQPNLIVSDYDEVSKVHIGLVGVAEVSKEDINPDGLEVLNPEWRTLTSIRAELDKYERWSQYLAKHLDK